MRQSLKIALSFLISVIIAALLLFLPASGLFFKFVTTNFYAPNIVVQFEKKIEQIAHIIDTYHQENINRFSDILENPYIASAFLPDQSKSISDIEQRERVYASLQQRFPDLLFVRFIEPNGRKIHFSTLPTDYVDRKTERQRIYYNYNQVETTIPAGEVLCQKEEAYKLTIDGNNLRFIYSFPVIDSYDILKGTALYYVSKEGLSGRLSVLHEPLANEELSLIEDKGILISLPEGELEKSREDILRIWERKGDRTSFYDNLIVVMEGKSLQYRIFSYVTQSSGIVSMIVPEEQFEIGGFYELIIIILICLTIFLIVYILFNIKQDPLVVITRRIKYLQIQFIKQFIDAQEELDWAKWRRDLLTRGSQLKRYIKTGIGRINKDQAQEVDDLINKSWDNILSIIGKKAEQKVPTTLDIGRIEQIIARALKSGNIILPAESVVATSELKNKDVEKEELETLDDVESVEETETIEEAVEEAIEDIIAIEEAGETEEEEAAPVAEEMEEAGEIEEIGVIEEAEEMEEAGEIEEVEVIEEAEEMEEAGEIEEIEVVEEAVEEAVEEGFASEDTGKIEGKEETEQIDVVDDIETLQTIKEPSLPSLASLGEVDFTEAAENLDAKESDYSLKYSAEDTMHQKYKDGDNREEELILSKGKSKKLEEIFESVETVFTKKDSGIGESREVGAKEGQQGGGIVFEEIKTLPPEPFEYLEELALAGSPDEYIYFERGGKYFLLKKEREDRNGKKTTEKGEEDIFSDMIEDSEIGSAGQAPGLSDADTEDAALYAGGFKTQREEFDKLQHDGKYRIYTIPEIIEILTDISKNIVMENGVYKINKELLEGSTEAKNEKLKDLVDAVSEDKEKSIKGDLTETKKDEEKGHILFGEKGIEYDEYLKQFDESYDTLTQIRSLMQFSRQINSIINGLLIREGDEYVLDVSVGFSDNCKDNFRFSGNDLYAEDIFNQRKILLINIPIKHIIFFLGNRCESDIKHMNGALFMPALFKGKEAYLFLAFSRFEKLYIKNIIKALKLVLKR